MTKAQKFLELSNVMFVGRPSQCIYRMFQGFLNHGILLWMLFVHGFWPIIILRFFGPFWRDWCYVTINAQLPCIYGGRNNNVLDHFWWNFNCEGQNGGNNCGIMMCNYGLDHRELGEQFLVLTDPPWCVRVGAYCMDDSHPRIKGEMATMVERLERTTEEWGLHIRTAVDFGLYFF